MSTDGGGGGGKKAGRPLAITSAVKETETKRERAKMDGGGDSLATNSKLFPWAKTAGSFGFRHLMSYV